MSAPGTPIPMSADDGLIYAMTILTPKPECVATMEEFSKDGAIHHQDKPECLYWHMTKTLDLEKIAQGWTDEANEGDFIVYHVWTSMEALLANGKSEYGLKMRAALEPLLSKPPVIKVGKSFAGFRRG